MRMSCCIRVPWDLCLSAWQLRLPLKLHPTSPSGRSYWSWQPQLLTIKRAAPHPTTRLSILYRMRNLYVHTVWTVVDLVMISPSSVGRQMKKHEDRQMLSPSSIIGPQRCEASETPLCLPFLPSRTMHSQSLAETCTQGLVRHVAIWFSTCFKVNKDIRYYSRNDYQYLAPLGYMDISGSGMSHLILQCWKKKTARFIYKSDIISCLTNRIWIVSWI